MLKLINKNYCNIDHVLKESLHSNCRKPRPKFDVTDAKLEFEFPEDLDTLKDREGKR